MIVRWLVVSTLFADALCAQPSAPSPIAAPLRELPWGQLNFLHTTDTHGWHGGHLQEPSYSADWGDYISFAKHLRDKADIDGSDLLLVDTGDRIEGNGLYDASEPKGQYTFDIFKEQHIDIICSGNHELYQQNSSENEFYKTVPNFKGNYLASNLDIYSPKTGVLEPLAPRFKKFTTKNQGIRILAFGFLYDFTGNANNTVVQRVEDTVKEDWFKEVLRDRDVDLIVVIGHVGIRSEEYDLLYKTIRSAQWDTPVQFFGGHLHIRDYKVYDSKSTALASGRYMETLGFLSITGLNGGGSKQDLADSQSAKLRFSRRYIDNNLFSLHHHSGKNSSTFPTDEGRNASASIASARKALDLDERYGCAPQTYWVNRAPYPHDDSIFTLLEKEVLPQQLNMSSRAKDGHKALVISNTGAMRFDIFEGPFTRDTTFLVSPFTSGFRYVADVPYKAAKQVLKLLNNEGPIVASATASGLEARMLAPPEQWGHQEDFTAPSQADLHGPTAQLPLSNDGNKEKLIPGYTTTDDAGTSGDDTLHSPISFYNVPNCIQAAVGFSIDEEDEPPETVDVVYNEFIERWILLALEYLGEKRGLQDTRAYIEGRMVTDVLTDWIREHWKCED